MRAPKGMLDVLPPESARWMDVVARFAKRAERFGFGLLLTPIVEHYEVFARVGETTDVVRKEMYDFVDRGGRRLALRPEGTAPVVRAFVQHRPTTPWKVWYLAPNFRAEQPQAGRYRQHWQLGAEVIGIDDPDIDVEIIELLWGFCRDLGLRDVRLSLNSMGDAETRTRYREVLLAYWHAHADLLGGEMERAEANPLRILDSKRPDWEEMLERAPQLGEYLSDASAAHFARVQEGLQAIGIPFEIAPRLVRGFDYYTSTVFELASEALDAAQNAIGGGGRYDKLAQEMGGPAAPSIGFGSGIERLLLACDAEGVLPVPPPHIDAFVVDLVGVSDTARLLAELRESGLSADRAYGRRSPKKQFAAADRSGARWAVIIGADEAERGTVAVKDLRSDRPQCEVRREEIAAWLQTRKDEARP
ncbi:MAG: histidyl-tRNA synthetase [Actinomycetota bacterium]|jgi:histidyl-tRNA synthetase|nr:histidyl-tRNA synthetase [Actinomycetota bacterium]